MRACEFEKKRFFHQPFFFHFFFQLLTQPSNIPLQLLDTRGHRFAPASGHVHHANFENRPARQLQVCVAAKIESHPENFPNATIIGA